MAVANPDYYVHWPAYSSNQACFAKEYGMPFLPWGGLSPRLLTADPLRPMYTADFSTGKRVADLGPWRMTEAIKSLGDSDPEVFLYAPRDDEAKPISWDSGSSGNTCAGLRGFDLCAEGGSATDSFRNGCRCSGLVTSPRFSTWV
ncbi:hypothetical protein ACU635_11320 [[Actinomadura] parvosata]|uniref:hypothetical protein n=1 Tax=[Actinomadura] parvosata TaxID=1955412 RepID=UPI00406CCC39